jgi:V/A-type H+-transporting ATPase subunit F
MYKIGVIGDKDTIIGFKSLGISVFPTIDFKEAHKLALRLSNEKYAVILVTEQLAINMQETFELFKEQITPALIVIPNNQGSLGVGMEAVKDSVKKAIGVDILFGKEG